MGRGRKMKREKRIKKRRWRTKSRSMEEQEEGVKNEEGEEHVCAEGPAFCKRASV